MEKTRFTILGMTGSGKTCYMLGMYYEVSAGMNGYTIIADDRDTDRKLARRFDMLNNKSLGEKRFPQPTDQPESFLFNLEYGYEDIMQFEWLDYSGDILDFRTDNDEARDELAKAVEESSTLLICIDGSDFCANSTNSKIKKVRRSAGNINKFLSDYKKKNNWLPPIAFIITKFDLCAQNTNEDEIKEVIEESFPALFIPTEEGEENNIVNPIAVIPVSLGEGIEDDENHGDLEPINIQLPIFYGIWFSLVFKNRDYEIEQEIHSDAIDELAYLKRDEEDSFFLWRDNDKISRLGSEISDRKSRIKDLEKIRKAMEKSQKKLERELSEINMVYFRGKWDTWS